MSTVKFFSMFTGIGGFEVGLERAGARAGVSFECVGYSEINAHAIEVYSHHYPEHINYGDATALDPALVPPYDLLVGGFPCQAFSIAGKRQGFDDTRGTLFFDIARQLAYHRPERFILENVKGLLSHAGGETFRTILATLDELGYSVQWQVLNSKDFGLPQSRERTYLVGNLGGEPAEGILPIAPTSGLHLREVTQGVADAFRVYDPVLARTLKAMGGGMGALTGLYWDGKGVRPLTAIETERAQGFDDGWTFIEGSRRSDIDRKRRCGNAVSTNVVEELAVRMYSHS